MPREKLPRDLLTVKSAHWQMNESVEHFKRTVVLANEAGYSIREIAEAAGVKSHNTIWRILNPAK